MGPSDGYLCRGPRERWLWALATAIALSAAILFEWIAARTPIPPGGDEGTWLLLSYPYVGISAPASVHLFSYPPLSLPFLGLAVVAAGGPLNGARLFVGAVVVALGLASYHLGRTMFRWRAVALLFEAALLFQPDFQQLLYFGAYPNLFGFVFLFLAVAFGLRYLRSRRDRYLAAFWGAATAAVLSHALVAVVLVAFLAIAVLGLLVLRRFPRALCASWTGRVGAAAFVGLGLLYYAGTWVAGTPRPNYLYTTVLTPSQSTTQLGEVFHALYLEPLSLLVHAGAFAFTYASALALLWALSAVGVAGFAVVRWRRPEWLTDRILVVLAWFLAVFAVALLTWYLALTADYRRFTYFLYPANLLLLGLVGDILLTRIQPGPRSADAPPESARGVLWRPWRQRAPPGILGASVIVLVLGISVYTVPAAVQYDNEDSHVAHGADFLTAMQAISRSGIAGAIFSTTPVVDRWPTALTGHDLYEVRPPTGYTYTANNLETDELASLTSGYRDAVTNGALVLAVPGVAAPDLNATPLYGAYVSGQVRSIFSLVPASITVDLGSSGPQTVTPGNGATVRWLTNGSGGTPTALAVTLAGAGFALDVVLATPAGGNSAVIQVVARATGVDAITGVQANLSAAGAGIGGARTQGASGFVWVSTPAAGGLSTFGNLTGASVRAVNGSLLTVATLPSTGTQALTFSLTLETSGTSNPVGDFQVALDSAAQWSQWGIRFLLLWSGSMASGPAEATYLEQEYGASVFAVAGPWTVLLWGGAATADQPIPNEAGNT